MKTHLEVIENTESIFLDALVKCNEEILKHYMHPHFFYGNDDGQHFKGHDNLPIFYPEILCVDQIDLIDRQINIYGNVAIVMSLEHRTGKYHGIHYDNNYRQTRVWKFNGKRWGILGAVSALV